MSAGTRTLRATLLAFAVSLGFLTIVAWQQRSDPFSSTYISDAQSYHRWAERIAEGGVAAEPVFHQSPGFPLLLGSLYRATGADGRAALAVALQLLLVSLAIALLVPLGRSYFGSTRHGLAAAALALLHGPLVLHAVRLLPVPLALATQAAALVALGAALERDGRRWAALAGACCGLACVARAELLLFVPVAALALWLRDSRRVVRVGLLLAAAALVVLPVTLHNARAGDAVLIASAGGENLFIGNQRGGDGGHNPLHGQAGDLFSQRALAQRIAEEESGRRLRASGVSRYWRDRAVGEIVEAPGEWLMLEGRKLARILHPGDPTDMYSFPLTRQRYVSALYLAFVAPWALWLLAFAGGALAWRTIRDTAWVPAALVFLHVVVLLLFFVSTRLRLPLLFFLTPFAGYWLVEAARAWRAGRRRIPALIGAAAVATCVGTALLSHPSPRETLRLAAVLSTEGRLDEALDVLSSSTGERSRDGLALDQAGWVSYKKGDHAAAAEFYTRALEQELPGPRVAQTRTRLAWAYDKLGATADAGRQHDLAVDSGFANAGTFYERGIFRLRQADRRGAIEDLLRATHLDPGYPEPRAALRRLGVEPG
ncbi:MAG: tetratricopeptide repeat protein [bacterium]|nr:tetratricopeptide repeat protein [bacterium]